MANNEDWVTVKLPRLMMKRVDDFVKTETARKNGVFSRSNLLTRILAAWLSNYDREFDLFKSNLKKERSQK